MKPFDPVEVAKLLAAGEVVHLGRHLVARHAGKSLSLDCVTCGCFVRTQDADLGDGVDRLADFFMRHQHAEVA